MFESLERQSDKESVEKIIIIDDSSTDKSRELIEEYMESSSYPIELRVHGSPRGLAANYNEGISLAESEYFILMHQDIILKDEDSFGKAMKPFSVRSDVMATRPLVLHPFKIWKTYGFWQKCFFSRHVGKGASALAGKFDCYRKSLFLECIGLFDNETFSTAGEDADIQVRFELNNAIDLPSDVNVIHLHATESGFGLRELFRKEAQYQESLGVIFRKHRAWSAWEFLLTFFRQLLVICLLVPYLQVVSLILIAFYSFLYTRLVYLEEYRDPRVLALPFVNVALLFVGTFNFARGLLTGRQRMGL